MKFHVEDHPEFIPARLYDRYGNEIHYPYSGDTLTGVCRVYNVKHGMLGCLEDEQFPAPLQLIGMNEASHNAIKAAMEKEAVPIHYAHLYERTTVGTRTVEVKPEGSWRDRPPLL